MRLLAFGCSFTQGIGLEKHINHMVDNPYGDPQHSSVFAWPAVTASKLGIPYINHGVGGFGVVDVFRRIMSTELREDDIVCVMWPGPHRVSLMKSAQGIPNETWSLSVFDGVDCTDPDSPINEREQLYFTKYWNEEQTDHTARVHISLAQHYLKDKVKLLINMSCPFYSHESRNFKDDYCPWAELEHWIGPLKWYDDAPYDGHHGPISHKKMSIKIKEYIDNLTKT